MNISPARNDKQTTYIRRQEFAKKAKYSNEIWQKVKAKLSYEAEEEVKDERGISLYKLRTDVDSGVLFD